MKSNIVFDIVKEKTNIRGYWKDESGKIYRDYIIEFSPSSFVEMDNKLLDLFFKGEKAVFVKGEKESFVLYPGVIGQAFNPSNIVRLKTCEKTFVEVLKASFFREYIKKHNGFTVYKVNKGYIFENWS
jgi:hypothetical protein